MMLMEEAQSCYCLFQSEASGCSQLIFNMTFQSEAFIHLDDRETVLYLDDMTYRTRQLLSWSHKNIK